MALLDRIEALEARIVALEKYTGQLRALVEYMVDHDRDIAISVVRNREKVRGVDPADSALFKRRHE